jgi:DNA modification methylase
MIKINNQVLNLNELNKYLTCNSTEFLEYIPESTKPFIDLIVTSPPYWDMKQYGEVEQTGFKQSYDDYLNDIEQTFSNIFKLSKDTATLYVNSDTLKRNGKIVRLPDDIATRLENIGWVHQDVIIWDKGKTLPWSRRGQMRNTFEYIHMFTKTNNYKYYIERIKTVDELKEWWVDYPERYSPQGKVPDNIWEYFIPTQGSWGTKKDFGDKEFKHACPFPPEMMARIIKLSSDEGDVVFDPYAGTGTLLATAMNLNRRYLGLDTNPDYKQIFEHVTIPLINGKIDNINYYYQEQERLKKLLQEAIYKLRIMKFPKALIKALNKEESSLVIKAALAIEKEMTNEDEEVKNKIGKASYLLVTDSAIHDDMKHLLKKLISKAPFSKYGLITDVRFVSSEEAVDLINSLDSTLNLYSQGNVSDGFEQVTSDEAIIIIKDEILNLRHTDKHIPPIFSNLLIKLNDYDRIPREKYIKRSYP